MGLQILEPLKPPAMFAHWLRLAHKCLHPQGALELIRPARNQAGGSWGIRPSLNILSILQCLWLVKGLVTEHSTRAHRHPCPLSPCPCTSTLPHTRQHPCQPQRCKTGHHYFCPSASLRLVQPGSHSLGLKREPGYLARGSQPPSPTSSFSIQPSSLLSQAPLGGDDGVWMGWSPLRPVRNLPVPPCSHSWP